MPARNRFKQVMGGPQGDDAGVTVKVPTIGELNEFLRQMPTAADGVDMAAADADRINTATAEFLSEHVSHWNWVDDDGQPLPMDMMGLTSEEQQFLISAVSGTTAQQEQSKKKLKK